MAWRWSPGIAAQQLSPNDVGLQFLENSTATALGLAALILVFGPVSGAHLNPVVSVADWILGRRGGTGISGSHVASYAIAQTLGGTIGAILANVMFDRGWSRSQPRTASPPATCQRSAR
ncbi:aquaporin [Mycobacterium sp. 2YAF39]|uniref:aquaporin n=1 Tax=Mycobacterium sp. 2YAF39 TaxID=3233033 RepID=UPI003F956DE1